MSSSQLPEMPRVSVVIAAYNGAAFLREAIDSALAQTYPNVEVIVVDDGSKDQSGAIATSYGDQIRYYYQKNAGTAAARNTGIRIATGDLIALLDQDDRWLPHKLERQVPLFRAEPNVGLVHSGGRVFDSATGETTSTYSPKVSLDVHDILEWCVVGCATTVFPRRLVMELGMFDPTVPGADDWDMWIRIAAVSKVVGCPEVLVEIREHGGNQGKNAERMFRIAARVAAKHRNLHPNCKQCRTASAGARRRVRDDYYAKACAAARRALDEKRYREAVGLRVRALLRCPMVLGRLPMRLARLARS